MKFTDTPSFTRLTAFALIAASTITLAGCANITESQNYETHSLKYLVNLSDVEEEEINQHLNKLERVLRKRLNQFDVAEVEFEIFEKENFHYVYINFGTINDIREIQNSLQSNNTFILKKKIAKSENYEEEIREKAQDILEELLAGARFEITAQNAVLKSTENVAYSETDWMYEDEIRSVFSEVLINMEPNEICEELVEYEEQTFVLAPPTKIVTILKLFDRQTTERVHSSPKQVNVSHILIAFKDATRASEEIERSSEEAESRAKEVKEKLDAGEDFAALAAEYSDDLSNRDSGGELGTPAGNGVYVEEFENAALSLEEEGEISDIVESPFGYHIIKANSITPAEEESSMEEQFRFGVVFFPLTPPEWEATDLTHEHLDKVEVMYTEEYDPYVLLTFNRLGREVLEEITEENMDNILGIFAGRNQITSFTVKDVNTEGRLRILRPSKTEEADSLKDHLTIEPLPVPIIFKPSN